MTSNVFSFVIIVLSFGLLAASLLSFLGNKHVFFFLISHFRFQYFLVAVLFFILLVWLNPGWLWLPLASLVINGIFLRNKNTDGLHPDLHPDVRIYSANLFIANFHYEKIATSIRASKADVVVLYEIFEDTFQELKKLLPEYVNTYFQQSPKNLGIAMFAKNFAVRAEAEHFSNPKIASLNIEVPIRNKRLRVVGYHTDAGMNSTKYHALKKEIAGLSDFIENTLSPLVVVGDFNDTTVSALFAPIFKAGVKDSRNAFERHVSWPLFLPSIFRLTLDHVLVKNTAHVVKRQFGERTGSDHLPVIADVSIQ